MTFHKMIRKIFGVPPGELSASIDNKPTKCEFIPESELHGVIEAAASNGLSYVPWRIDADGEQWFRAVPTVNATAADDDVAVLDDEFEDAILADYDDDSEDDDDSDDDQDFDDEN